jgi:HEAT repeat protein
MTEFRVANGAQDSPEDPGRCATQIEGLRSRDGRVRLKARGALTLMGSRAVPGLLPLLKAPEDGVRWEAAKTLAGIADARAVPDLVTALEDRNSDVRWLAASGLIAMRRAALVPLLDALLGRSDSVWLREGAHHVFRGLAKTDLGDVVAPVLAALEGDDPGFAVQRPGREALHRLRE